MSFITVPAVVNAGAPGVNDDVTKGFAVGDLWVDSSVTPRVAYTCTNNSTGAAAWTSGGVASHPALATLGWSASGHTGTTNSVACFSNTGAALTAQATQDGQVLSYTGGVLQFVAMAATVTLVSSRSVNLEYLPSNATLVPATDGTVINGTVI